MLLRTFIRHTRGAAGVEFALVSTAFLTMLLGVVEVARYVADRQDLMAAVHTTGRYAIVHGSSSSSPATTSSLQTMVGNDLFLIKSSSVTATASFSPNNNPGSKVTITASYTWTPLVSLLHLPSATISATSIATIQN
ncbi:MAG TPA: TadE/TadG family type IV pilus assembly protein [Methylovirgula sp.]|jgi:Flp pilus assembly protein TadG